MSAKPMIGVQTTALVIKMSQIGLRRFHVFSTYLKVFICKLTKHKHKWY